MSPKAKTAAKKVPAAKAPAKEAKAAKPVAAKETKGAKPAAAKAAKGGKVAEPQPVQAASPNEDDEEDEAMASSGGGGGGSAAALAAASSGTESASFKNFRHSPDMENFYRFIFENDLRVEALAIMNDFFIEKAAKKAAKLGGKSV